MKNTMEYQGYVGTVEFSEEDRVFFGKVLGIRSLLSYEGTTGEELINDFHGVIDNYLAMCKEKKMKPEKAYKGSFNIRISPDLHKKLAIQAIANNMSLNSYIEKTLNAAIA